MAVAAGPVQWCQSGTAYSVDARAAYAAERQRDASVLTGCRLHEGRGACLVSRIDTRPRSLMSESAVPVCVAPRAGLGQGMLPAWSKAAPLPLPLPRPELPGSSGPRRGHGAAAVAWPKLPVGAARASLGALEPRRAGSPHLAP